MSATSPAHPAPVPGPDRFVDDVLDVLGEPGGSVDPDENLLDRGLDSIRLMTLVDRWNRTGLAVSFLDLAERPTLAQWRALLAHHDPEADR